MNCLRHRRLRLAARNEGKIKSYESCIDVRAWSHDIRTRNRYLRDWIKCDMPICLVPVCTLSSILSIMTCSSRERVTSRCHSRCKSKALLDRLCSSCTVMKECLSNNREFEKYFKEENLETMHWPCDKCLEIFKSIKMFWKIVIEKVLKIHLPKYNEYKCAHICSVRDIAKEWQEEIIDEAMFIRDINPFITKQEDIIKKTIDLDNELVVTGGNKCCNNTCLNKCTETDCEFRTIAIQTELKSLRQKISKCTSARIKMINLNNESYEEKDNEVIMVYENNYKRLQYQFNVQKNEVDRLKNENTILNGELQRYRENEIKNVYPSDRSLKPSNNTFTLGSHQCNSKENVDFNSPKDIESEMIITLKTCKNESFRHVSVIQVLHKTNELNFLEIDGSCKKEDPIQILNRVHETFEAMVHREISIANKTNRDFDNKNVVIKSSFCNIRKSKSAPSCSTSSNSMASELIFESANEANGTSVSSRK